MRALFTSVDDEDAVGGEARRRAGMVWQWVPRAGLDIP
jgi:hypothetical protein